MLRLTTALLLIVFGASGSLRAAEKMNVLFLAVDDLRPELGCYGVPVIQSPNIDALAAKGMIFTRAYCQQAVCSPTRSSLMTGCRPDTTKVYDLDTHFRRAIPDVVTLPQQFKQHGWHAQAFGKIYHGGYDDPASWSAETWTPGKRKADKKTAATTDRITATPVSQKSKKKAATAEKKVERDPKTGLILKGAKKQKGARGPAWEMSPLSDEELPDGQIATHAIETLREVKDKPFFLAVGFMKPHLPFIAPKAYFDRYDPLSIPLSPTHEFPKGAPDYAGTNSGELRNYSNIPRTEPISEELARELKRGYYAATTYTDAQIGRVLAELDALKLRENTIVILWGDHGWKLGEHGAWVKHTNWEPDTRVLLALSVPGQKTAGQSCHKLVEFVDIYPTLCELCGVPKPDTLEGTSFAPLIRNPDQPWKSAAFSQYPRQDKMGYAMRTARYRYVEWQKDGKAVGRELYDYEADPNETESVVDRSENADLVARLSAELKAGWQAARPKAK